MDYSDRFRDYLDTTLGALPSLSIFPIAFTFVFKVHLPEYPMMGCFLAVLGMHVLQILFSVAVVSIPKKDSLFFAMVAYVSSVFVIPALCLHWMRY